MNNSEKLTKDAELLNDVFTEISEKVSTKYSHSQQLQDADFENFKDEIDQEIFSKQRERVNQIATLDVNKSNLLNHVLESMKLSKVLLSMNQQEINKNLQKMVCYNTLIDLGILVSDHRNYVQTNNLGNLYSLADRVCSSQLLSIAHGLHSLRDEIDINYSKFSDAVMKNYFSDDNIMDFNIEIEAYDKEIITKEIITIGHDQVFDEIGNADRTDVYVEVKDDNGNNKKLVIGDITEMRNAERYFVNDYSDGIEILVKVGRNKNHVIKEKIKGQNIEYYLSIDGYEVKFDNIIKDFTTDVEEEAILDKLHQLSNDKQLLENKKYIEDIGDVQDVETDQGYNNIVEEIKQNLLAKGVREDTFDRFKSHFDDLGEKVFADYISNVEGSFKEKGIAFDRNKFDSAKIKGVKGGKFFSLMAIYDLLDSIGDTATLGRHDNDALKQIFGINGILDAMDDVRTSLNISPNSKVGRLINKIPQPIRQAFVKIIDNPVVQSITFATIAYQFGYSVNEIAQGNNHPLNYYWTASSGIKLASMSIRPISAGVSFTIKSISATTKILRGLSAAGKVLGRAAVVTMVADVLITIGVEIHERIEYTKAIAEQVPLLPGNEQAEVFFAKVIKFFTGRDVEKEYGDIIRVKGYLNHVKEVAIKLLDDNYNIAAIVQYVISIEEKYSEIIRDADRVCPTAVAFAGFCDNMCKLEKKYNNISFSNVNTASNAEKDLSSLDISKTLPMRSYTLVMNEGWERSICYIKNSPQCYQGIEEKKVYVVNTDAKHIPHLTKYEYENLGLRIVKVPLKYSGPKSQCGKVINEENKYGDIHRPCNTGKIHKRCQESFTLSGEPFIFTNPKRKDPGNTKKQTFPRGSVLYISGPKTLTAANYPAVMHIPEGSYIRYVGSKNNETIFIINDHTSGTLEGGAGKENTLVMNVKANNIAANLHSGTIRYGNSNNIRLVNTYNYVSNSDNKQNITTHCETRLINVKNAEVWQNSSNCTDKDYEVRVVNKENVHHRGLKQTIFIVNEDSDNARIISDLGSTEKIKGNIDVIRVQVNNITQWGVSKDTEKDSYSLDLLANDTQSIASSTTIDDFKNLVIQVNCQGITESVTIQDKSLSDTIEDIRYQKLRNSGSDTDREIIQNSEKKLKAFIQASILDQELPSTYQVVKDIANNNNFNIPIFQIEVTKNHMGIPSEKVIIAGMYSDQVIVDFSYNNSDVTSSYQKYRNNGGSYDYDHYMTLCNYYQDVTVEGGEGQHQYIIKLPDTLNSEVSSSPIRINLKIKNKAAPYQSMSYNIIDFAELNVTDVDSISIQKGKRSYTNECYNQSISDLTEDSLEIKDITVLGSEGTRWSLSVGLVDYFQSPEHQQIVLQMNNKLYKIDSTNLKLEHVEMDPNSFRYYQPDEQGLQIYHNQPIDKNEVGLVDFRDKSILGFDMEIADDSLVLSYGNSTIAKVENWSNYQPAREMMFAFNDTMVSNSKCIASACNSEDVVVEFTKEKETLLGELLNAVAQGNLDKVKDFIKKGTNAKGKYNNGWTLMHYAAYEGKLNIVIYLVDKWAILEIKYNDGRTFSCNTSLDSASDLVNSYFDTMKCLVGKENSLEIKDNNGRTPLHYAAYNGKLDIVKYFIDEEKIDVSIKDNGDWTPLHWASWNGQLNVAKYLIGKGANLVNIKDKDGKTPLDIADQKGYTDIVEILKQAQSGLYKKYNELLIAVLENNLSKVEDLVSQGTSLETKDSYGWTLLHFASIHNYSDMVEYLINKGVDINAKDQYGKTPLHLTSWLNRLDAMKCLISNDANINAKDNNGKTPLDDSGFNSDAKRVLMQAYLDKALLITVEDSDREKIKDLVAKDVSGGEFKHGAYYCAWSGHLDMVKLLVERDVDVNGTDKYGCTLLHWAALGGFLEIVSFLIEAGANINAEDIFGRKPMDVAIISNHKDIIEYLKGYSDSMKRLEEKLSRDIEKPAQRRRRHHHGDHSRHQNHLSRKPLAIDLGNQPEIAASSGTRPSSWINGLFGWVKSSVGGLFYSRAALSEEASNTASSIPQVDEQFAKASVSNSSSISTTLPSDGTDKKQENGGFFRDNIDYVNANIKQMRERQTPVKFKPSGGNTILEMGDHYLSQVDFNGTIMLLDLLIRKVTGQKYISTVDQSISPLEAQGYALNITEGFEKVVEQAGLKSGVSMHRLNIDFVEIQKEVTGKIMSGKFDEISGVLNSYLEEACPGREAGCPGKLSPKKFDKFIAQFNKGLLNQSIEQILHNRDGRLEVDGTKKQQMSLEPQSYLSNASVHSHSKDKVSTCLSDVGVTKLGNTLSK
ncbi:ankyrin repeat domain-containing protein [Wolbachia endosymbiont (group A) of Longitarsus flavicornis]|uniref:ankyrin repeat domain-containing protein n=1 Tax=Wolbachia endosymbiont (group A) of Longitarsus flavicornis TaxID=3066134 RepID=UPI0030CA2555